MRRFKSLCEMQLGRQNAKIPEDKYLENGRVKLLLPYREGEVTS